MTADMIPLRAAGARPGDNQNRDYSRLRINPRLSSVVLRAATCALASGVLTLSAPISAQQAYLGLGGGQSTIDPNTSNTAFTTRDKRDTGGKALAGWMINDGKTLGVEAFWSYLGKTVMSDNSEIKYTHYGLALKLVAPLGNNWSAFLNLGGNRLEAEWTHPLIVDTRVKQYLGAGLRQQLGSWWLQFSYDRYGPDSSLGLIELIRPLGRDMTTSFKSKDEMNNPKNQNDARRYDLYREDLLRREEERSRRLQEALDREREEKREAQLKNRQPVPAPAPAPVLVPAPVPVPVPVPAPAPAPAPAASQIPSPYPIYLPQPQPSAPISPTHIITQAPPQSPEKTTRKADRRQFEISDEETEKAQRREQNALRNEKRKTRATPQSVHKPARASIRARQREPQTTWQAGASSLNLTASRIGAPARQKRDIEKWYVLEWGPYPDYKTVKTLQQLIEVETDYQPTVLRNDQNHFVINIETPSRREAVKVRRLVNSKLSVKHAKRKPVKLVRERLGPYPTLRRANQVVQIIKSTIGRAPSLATENGQYWLEVTQLDREDINRLKRTIDDKLSNAKAPTRISRSAWRVQVGAYRSKSRAESVYQRLKHTQLANITSVRPRVAYGNRFYTVQVFASTRSQAESIKNIVDEILNVDSLVMRHQ